LLEVGSVISVSMPTPKYPVPQVFGQPQEMVVDIVVKVNNQDVTYQKLPANLDIADFGTNGIVVADNKLAMNSEIMSLKQKSVDALNNMDFHQQVILNCDKMLSDLNPEFAEKQQQQAEINELKTQVSDLTRNISNLMQMNKDLIAQLKYNKEEIKHENVGN
jgi:predicted RNase H-like nuclease (RuvC/YqgF family)